MKRQTLLGMLACVSCAIVSYAVEPGSFEEQAAAYSWACEPVEGLPNVLILGDSISIGYTLQVREYLTGKANVYRPLAEDGGPQNCGAADTGVRSLPNWLGSTEWDVIHFNWGLHDLKRVGREDGKMVSSIDLPPRISIADYQKKLQRCIDQMKLTGARLIFATTTAYPNGVSPVRVPEDAVRYNVAALEVMGRNGIVVNDLYALTVGRLDELQKPVNVHFSEKGSAVIGKQVASAIATQLGVTMEN